jgi:hypothetical protein
MIDTTTLDEKVIRSIYPNATTYDLERIRYNLRYGRIAQASTLSAEQKIQCACAAHVRHQITGYEDYLNSFVAEGVEPAKACVLAREKSTTDFERYMRRLKEKR